MESGVQRVEAVEHIRRMRGGAQSHLLRCSDGFYYVVKFQNNPQHVRVLVNDWIGTRLAGMIGLPVPVPAIVEVQPRLLQRTPELRVDLGGKSSMFTSGPSFGSRYVVPPSEGQVFDYLPSTMMSQVRNVADFAGILALDKWTCNGDGRQVAFWKRSGQRKLTASFIDQGYCFNAGDWNFPDAPLKGVFARNEVYAGIRSWECFEPWLSRIENFPESSLWALAAEIPAEWGGAKIEDLSGVLAKLVVRRSRVRELILDFKNSSRNPFPYWQEAVN